jgi:DNA-damage-inducible protein J
MATESININTDADIIAQAQQIFESIGLDLSSAVNLFLKQTVKANNLPFIVGVNFLPPVEKAKEKRISRYGVWRGKYSLPENFDAPLDDFEGYK